MNIMLSLLLATMGAAESSPEPDNILVGVNYFAGWWEPLPNKWHDHKGQDWRERFPERVPLLGEYNTQETMDKEIVAAADYGVDFFSILWYYNKPADTGDSVIEAEPNARFLERGITNFLNSPENHRMKFMIEFCNHPPYEVETDEDWEYCLSLWTKWMKHPSYLRINGKAVLKIHGFHYFVQQNNGDLELCRKRLDAIREAARKADVGELLIGSGVSEFERIGKDHPAAPLFDFTATYMGMPQLEQHEEDYPYQLLSDYVHISWREHSGDGIPYVPFVPAGWCPRPWSDPRPCFTMPDKKEWTQVLADVKLALESTPSLGFPGQKAFTIYAWNEFGEGGFVAPTQGEGYMKLEGIKEVFK